MSVPFASSKETTTHLHSFWPVTLVLLGTATSMGHAQQIMQRDLEAPLQEQEYPSASIGAGIGLGVVGFAAGAFAALVMTQDCTEVDCLEAAFYGAAAGGTFGMALGVHLGNKRRGSLALDFVTGTAIWGAGIEIAEASNWDDTVTGVAFVAIPNAQLASTVAVERATGRSRLRGPRVNISVVPRFDGGAMFAGRIVY